MGRMTLPTCPTCGAELGPWERSRCFTHDPRGARTIADQAVLVLEQERGAVFLHDIQRGIGREAGRQAEWQSVSAVVGADRRFCWSGKGMYGLFRHGRIPWVRTLADVATFILVAANQPLSQAELRFLMKWRGYRFQDISLDGALGREGRFAFGWEAGGPGSPAGWKATLKDRMAQRERFDILAQPIEPDVEDWLQALFKEGPASQAAFQATPWPVDELITRWGGIVQKGLRERMRRLGSGDDGDEEVIDGS